MFRLRVPDLSSVVLASLWLGVNCVSAFSQRNNPYASNPNPQVEQRDQATVQAQPRPIATVQPVVIPVGDKRTTIARRQPMMANAPTENSKPLTEIYRVGAGDVLFVNLKNAPKAGGYYTVRRDGTIDFPLAGESPSVTGKTVEQIEDALAATIVLYADPQIEVKIREYGSHKVTVSGMAERVGDRSLTREAIPLFAIRAEAFVMVAATKVNIRRGEMSQVETYDLNDERTNEILVYPGNSVEFTADGQRSGLSTSRFVYIAGEVNLTGQREYTEGMTLFQAVTASGGVKGNPKRATLRRKGDKGVLNVVEYNLRSIRDGKATDPVIAPGDMIEITN
ncbi:MAG: polysaccharide biosynthesis/export family protein [Pyrinomonadaceae bacterium]